MRYVSTRGEAPPLGFEDVLLAGLAVDGGLYVPQAWPRLAPDEIADCAGLPYHEVAARLIAPYCAPDLDAAAVAELCREAYGPDRFRHAAVCPLVQLDANLFVLELFHGPTLAFKDLAMQLLARLMDRALAKRGRRVAIVAATSGDTGGAAIEAFRGAERADVFVLYPHGRVSEVQRLQMTTPREANVHALAVDGDFDACQALVKAMFAHRAFAEAVSLSAVNSINWARIVAQLVYYVVAAVALGAPHRPVRFVVPTGNFGDVFAGEVARRMGLPVEKLVIATNVNDILARTLAAGRYEVRAVTPSTSPSMDIQVSSNFERLLYEAHGRDAAAVRAAMASLAQGGAFEVGAAALEAMRATFAAASADDAAAAAAMRAAWRPGCAFGGYLADPHTATALHAARAVPAPRDTPCVVLATAHPAKFPDAVEDAAGVRPALPDWLELDPAAERVTRLPADRTAIEAYVAAHARSAGTRRR
jgi:threonine synthase